LLDSAEHDSEELYSVLFKGAITWFRWLEDCDLNEIRYDSHMVGRHKKYSKS